MCSTSLKVLFIVFHLHFQFTQLLFHNSFENEISVLPLVLYFELFPTFTSISLCIIYRVIILSVTCLLTCIQQLTMYLFKLLDNDA